jgi:putative flippase GtrA
VLILAVATAGFGIAAWLANVIATGIASIPSYHLNRRWTWTKRGTSDPWRELIPFWALAFTGLGLSTLLVAMVDPRVAHLHVGQIAHTGAVIAAHLSGFGVLWIFQFLLLDRLLFRPAPEEGAAVKSGSRPFGLPRIATRSRRASISVALARRGARCALSSGAEPEPLA